MVDTDLDDPSTFRFAPAPALLLSAEVREDAQSFAYVRRADAGFEVGVQPIGGYEGVLAVD